MNKFVDDFNLIWRKIDAGNPIAFARYADGECALMQGRAIGSGTQATDIDRWSSPNYITELGIDLKESLIHTETNYYYAISCDCCDPNGKKYLLNFIKQKKEFITFSNLWINSNYIKFIDKISQLKKEVIILANFEGKNNNFPFPVKSYVPFENNCVEQWKLNKEKIKEKLKEISQNQNTLFFISVGPMSEVIIDYLWKCNPNNQYIDVGSSIDEFVHGKKTRPYMFIESQYAHSECKLSL